MEEGRTWLKQIENRFRKRWLSREGIKKDLVAAELLSTFDIEEAVRRADYSTHTFSVLMRMLYRRTKESRGVVKTGRWSERLSEEELAALLLSALPGHVTYRPHHEIYARWTKLPPERVLELIRYAWKNLSEDERRKYVKVYIRNKGERAKEELERYIGEEALKYLE